MNSEELRKRFEKDKEEARRLLGDTYPPFSGQTYKLNSHRGRFSDIWHWADAQDAEVISIETTPIAQPRALSEPTDPFQTQPIDSQKTLPNPTTI